MRPTAPQTPSDIFKILTSKVRTKLHTLLMLYVSPHCHFDASTMRRSFLYGGKAAAINAVLLTGNLEVKKLEVDIEYASTPYTWKNMTDIPVTIEIIEVTNKRDQQTRLK